MPPRVNSENLNRRRKVDLSVFEKIARLVLAETGAGNAEINLVFVSSQKIRAMNRRYFGIDASTDVISWPAGKDPAGSRFTVHGSRKFLGDIAVSTDKAARNAAVYGTTFREETALYVIHGVLHLLGHEDTSAKGRERMRKREDELLQRSGKYL